MDIFGIITFFGGLAFFIYGMAVMSGGLEKLSGSKLEKLLRKMTARPLHALMLGAGITAAVQSSSATTVMLVGLVNSGIMDLGQSIGIIMGSNIGTTMTAWILSLAGIESDVIWMKLLKPANFSLIFAFVGAVMFMLAKTKKRKDIGTILIGFAVLMYGMKLMSSAVKPLADIPEFSNILTAFENPILGVVVGALFTALIQSSSASVGVLQALSLTGGITYGMGIPIIMGQNIGTCITALLSSLGANKNGKRVAVVHIVFNLIGATLGLIALMIATWVFRVALLDQALSPFAIAVVHSIFNVATTFMLLPMVKVLEKIAYRVVKGDAGPKEAVHIDENLFATPGVAIAECSNYTVNMAFIAYSAVSKAMKLIPNYNKKEYEEIMDAEDQLDLYEDKLGSYLVQLSSKDIMEKESHKLSQLLRGIGDYERIGDHAVNLLEAAQEIQDKKIAFSKEGQQELNSLFSAIEEVMDMTVNSFATQDIQLAKKVEPLEQVVDELVFDIRKNHIQRLQAGSCTIELGFILTDILTNLERISDHCSNIACTLIESENNSVALHAYPNLKSNEFDKYFREYKEKYSINH